MIPLSEPIAHDLPAPEIVADKLGLLGVLDHSKIGASSLFFLPSSPPNLLALHETALIAGDPIHACRYQPSRCGTPCQAAGRS